VDAVIYMEHASLVRIIFKDERKIIGGYSHHRSNTYKVFLLGHSHYYWRRDIRDAFVFKGERWHRVIGDRTVYDSYIEKGGTEWPETFFNILYSNDI